MSLRPLAWMLPLVLMACAGKADDSGSLLCEPGAVFPGTIEATVDGTPWVGVDLEWTPAGEGFQLTTAIGVGADASPWRMTLVTYTGLDATDGGRFPVEVPLDTTGTEGWALLYPTEGSSFSTKDGEGGVVIFDAIDGDDLLGCVQFDAASADATIALSGGRFRAVPRIDDR